MFFAAVLCFFVALTGCDREEKPSSPQPSLNTSTVPEVEVCSLIQAKEFAAVQGTAIEKAKAGEFSNGKFLVRQCYYEASDRSRSVNLAVTTRAPNSPVAMSPGAFWKEKFGPRSMSTA